MNGWVVLIILLVIAAGFVLYAVSAYNSLVRMRNLVEESWRQVDVELNRRYELIPNLVETVKGYARHEQGTLENVIKLRNQAVGMGGQGHATEQRSRVEEELSTAVRQLLVTVEAYPDLKANVNFAELQRQLADTEDRIAAGRRYYNANVRNYNTRIESFPTNILAGMFQFQRATYFEVEDAAVRAAPKVSFGQSAPAAPQAPAQAPALESADSYYETPNYGVRSGVQDAQNPAADPLQTGGSHFGYQAAPQPVVPPQQAQPPRQGQYGQQG